MQSQNKTRRYDLDSFEGFESFAAIWPSVRHAGYSLALYLLMASGSATTAPRRAVPTMTLLCYGLAHSPSLAWRRRQIRSLGAFRGL